MNKKLTAKQRKMVFERFCQTYEKLKPKLEDCFEIKIDCSPFELDMQNGFWADKKSAEILAREHGALIYYCPDGKNGLGVNTFCHGWENNNVPYRLYCAHELLHHIYFNKFPDYKVIKEREITVFIEGFPEYCTLNTFSGWFSDESEAIMTRKYYHLKNSGFYYEAYLEHNLLSLGYNQHALGYQFFLENLGELADKKEVMDFVSQKEFYNPQKLVQIVQDFIRKVYYTEFGESEAPIAVQNYLRIKDFKEKSEDGPFIIHREIEK